MKDKDKDIEIQIKEDLVINDADIRGELLEHATKQYYWGSMWARALRKSRTQKVLVEELEAKIATQFREFMALNHPEVRVTEKMINEHLTQDKEYQEAVRQQIHADYLADIFNVARIAFEQRGRLLLELAKQRDADAFYEYAVENMKKEFERRVNKKSKKESTETGTQPAVVSE